MGFSKLSEIIEESENTKKPFWEVVLENDCRERNIAEAESVKQMHG